jgi:LacI family transcriptional regulator
MNDALKLPKVDRRDPTPKYLQVRQILVEAIRSGRLVPGARLPSTKELSSLIGVSLITAQKALEGLVEAGCLRREVGRGTYVREDVDLVRSTRRPLFVRLLFDHHVPVNIDGYYHGTLITGLRRAAMADATRRVEFFFHDHFDLRGKAGKDVGVICLQPPLEARDEIERLARRYPVVLLGGTFPGGKVASVACDNEGGARQAVRHLLELGHRRFVFLSGPLNSSSARDRARGAIAELAAHGIRLDDSHLPVSRDAILLDEETRAFVQRCLRDADRPTAIVAGGFYLALGAMQAVRDAGLSIPRDVSIVGFDDPASAPLLDPPLTTVRQPLEEMALRAYQSVRQAIAAGSAEPASCKLPTELVARESTGPARQPAMT